MFQIQTEQPDVGAIFIGKLLTAVYRRLEIDGKFEGALVDYEGTINRKGDVIRFADGKELAADKVLNFKNLLDGFKASGYPSPAQRAFQAVQDKRFMSSVARQVCKKLLAHFPHDWTHFACQMGFSGEHVIAIVAVNNENRKPLQEANFQFIGDDELDQMIMELEPAATAAHLPEA